MRTWHFLVHTYNPSTFTNEEGLTLSKTNSQIVTGDTQWTKLNRARATFFPQEDEGKAKCWSASTGLGSLWRKVDFTVILITVKCHPLAIWHSCLNKIYAAVHIYLMSCLGSVEYSAKTPVTQHHADLNPLIPWVEKPMSCIKMMMKINSWQQHTWGSVELNRLRNGKWTGNFNMRMNWVSAFLAFSTELRR